MALTVMYFPSSIKFSFMIIDDEKKACRLDIALCLPNRQYLQEKAIYSNCAPTMIFHLPTVHISVEDVHN
jgi:hypothetical protein